MEREKNEIVITAGSMLSDIQMKFSASYPYLMIEFLQRNRNISTYRFIRTEPVTQLKALPGDKAAVTIDISQLRTVAEVSHDLSTATGVIVRISRKSGQAWSPITLTDAWSLERQNAAGEYISELMGDHGS